MIHSEEEEFKNDVWFTKRPRPYPPTNWIDFQWKYNRPRKPIHSSAFSILIVLMYAVKISILLDEIRVRIYSFLSWKIQLGYLFIYFPKIFGIWDNLKTVGSVLICN